MFRVLLSGFNVGDACAATQMTLEDVEYTQESILRWQPLEGDGDRDGSLLTIDGEGRVASAAVQSRSASGRIGKRQDERVLQP